MCGRYGRRADKQRIAEWMQTHNTNVFDETYLAPSYNVAPTDFQPIVRLDRDGQRELTIMRWGLVPYWAKDSKIGFSTINAKSETVTTSPAFREAMKHRRCLVPAEWFYEWAKIDAKTKQPCDRFKRWFFVRIRGTMGNMERQGEQPSVDDVHHTDHRSK